MALRLIREQGDDILAKTSREVTELNDKIRLLIEDMKETMYDVGGVGLAAVQVGVLRRIVIIDVSGAEGDDEDRDGQEADAGQGLLVMINPRIVDRSGEQTGDEGCLSVPGMVGTVTRPDYVKAVYLDENFKPAEVEGRGLLARAICHELDHLDGHLYTEKVEGDLRRVHSEDD